MVAHQYVIPITKRQQVFFNQVKVQNCLCMHIALTLMKHHIQEQLVLLRSTPLLCYTQFPVSIDCKRILILTLPLLPLQCQHRSKGPAVGYTNVWRTDTNGDYSDDEGHYADLFKVEDGKHILVRRIYFHPSENGIPTNDYFSYLSAPAGKRSFFRNYSGFEIFVPDWYENAVCIGDNWKSGLRLDRSPHENVSPRYIFDYCFTVR